MPIRKFLQNRNKNGSKQKKKQIKQKKMNKK